MQSNLVQPILSFLLSPLLLLWFGSSLIHDRKEEGEGEEEKGNLNRKNSLCPKGFLFVISDRGGFNVLQKRRSRRREEVKGKEECLSLSRFMSWVLVTLQKKNPSSFHFFFFFFINKKKKKKKKKI